jgi:hypothetical protein
MPLRDQIFLAGRLTGRSLPQAFRSGPFGGMTDLEHFQQKCEAVLRPEGQDLL